MSPLFLLNGKILVKDGALASSIECCCTECSYVSIYGGSQWWGTGNLTNEISVGWGNIQQNDDLLNNTNICLIVCGPFNTCLPNGTTQGYFSDAAIYNWIRAGGILCLKTEFNGCEYFGPLIQPMNDYLTSIGVNMSVCCNIGLTYGRYDIDVIEHPVTQNMNCVADGANSASITGGVSIMKVKENAGFIEGTVLAGMMVGDGAVFLVGDSNILPTAFEITENALSLLQNGQPLFSQNPGNNCFDGYICKDYTLVGPGESPCEVVSTRNTSLPNSCDCIPTKSRCVIETGECTTYYGLYPPLLSLTIGTSSGSYNAPISYTYNGTNCNSPGWTATSCRTWSISSVDVTNGGEGYIDGQILLPTLGAGDVEIAPSTLIARTERLSPINVGAFVVFFSFGGNGADITPILTYSTANDPLGYWTVTGFTINNPGVGYLIGQVIRVYDSERLQDVGVISSVGQNNGITGIDIINDGGKFFKSGNLIEVCVNNNGCSGGQYYNIGNVDDCTECQTLHQQYLQGLLP